MLAAGTGLKLSDYLGYLFNFNGGFARKLNGDFFLFWHFSVRYYVSFIKIIRISMPHRLNVIFLAFFMKFYFLAFKNLKKILKIKITAIVFTSFLNILYYRLYD